MAFSLSKIFNSSKVVAASKPTATVGIDVGGASVKVVEVEETEQAIILRTYGELQLGPYGQADLGATVSLPNKERTEAVVDVMRESQVTSRHGALAMPLSSSFLTVMPMTFKEEVDPAAQVTVEAKRYVPLPLAEVTFDWSELAPIGDTESQVKEILLAVIENKALSDYRDLLNIIGMTGEPAEIEAFSLVRALTKPSDTTVAIIDIGAKTSKLYITRNGSLERIHRVGVGGAQITKRTAELLGTTFAEAENKKRSYTRDDSHARDIYKAMSNVIENPLREFARLISQYEARTSQPVGRIVCAGGVAASPYFISYTKDIMANDRVEIANPFEKVGYPAFMEDTLRDIGPTFAVSLGAALRQFQTEQ